MLNQAASSPDNSSVQNLQSEVKYRTKLQEIGNQLNAAPNLDETLMDLEDEITKLFEAERFTVYFVDGIKRMLISRFKSGKEYNEIKLPLSLNSLAGYAAFKQTSLNIKNVYDKKELAGIDAKLKFDSTWDRQSGFTTRQALVMPILFEKYLLGAFQLINKKNDERFSETDEVSATELAKILGIAFYNQKRVAKGRKGKFDYLLENHVLTQKELDTATKEARKRKEPLEAYLMRFFKIPKKDIGKSLSRYYGVPFFEYNPNTPIPGELIVGLRVPFMRNNFWVPLRIEDGKIVIAVDNPHDLRKIDDIKALFPGKAIKFNVAMQKDILDLIALFTQDEKELAAIDDILSQLQDEQEEIDDAEGALDEEASAVVQLVNKIILDAIAREASDIHIEPYGGKQNTQVRIRVDGNCYVYQTIPYSYRNAVVSRIKIMSDLDIAERRLPQDGKIKFKKFGGKNVELRVATVPTAGGLEDVVMRVLAAGEPIPLDKMQFSKKNYDNYISVVTKPYGLILVCGPTGSGKTTTLHSALGYINRPEKKIWTAEDPVEITQAGLRQVQVKPKIGFDFAAAMRSFLRADPDVIMVGEMRDRETTHIGIEASLTGHLVFSTLHTNSAPESITRLLDMGMDPFNFADAILCIMAQRLCLTLCKECKEAYTPTQTEYDELVREYGGEEAFGKGLNIKYSKDLKLHRPKGCDFCNNTGYRGRIALHELLMGTDEMKKRIQRKAMMEDVAKQAVKDGMTTLKQDGIDKIFQGFVDLVNVRKVCIK
ncbi:MAG: GspE/PulE family protein [Desulfobacterales bacterium]|nr:GspE/PulE family protein [Desulfobacterales bacterium]MDJ0913274.1 GspE/PulE family protein [Desulfobacterales bacterium]